MLNHRPTDLADMRAVFSDLSDVTKAEIDAALLGADLDVTAGALLSAGPAETSLWDNTLLAVFGHYLIGPGHRSTWCFATKACETLRKETMMAAAEQIKRIMQDFPRDKFTSISYSNHPKRDHFFAMIGFNKCGYSDKAIVFELFPVGTVSIN